MAGFGVRYLVNDVASAVAFYRDLLGFAVAMDFSPGFAAVERGELTLYLSGVGGSGGGSQPMPDGSVPAPGGWNRIQLVVDDLDGEIRRLRELGARFRNETVVGRGGSQVLLDDPSGNPVELFQPA